MCLGREKVEEVVDVVVDVVGEETVVEEEGMVEEVVDVVEEEEEEEEVLKGLVLLLMQVMLEEAMEIAVLPMLGGPNVTLVERSLQMIMQRNPETLCVLELERRVVLHKRICLVDP